MKEILLKEYNNLKIEQLARIKIRDTLIYISLSIFGGIFSFSMFGSEDKSIVLLVLPTVSFVLAWTYVVNDEKISQIGEYIRCRLAPKIKELEEGNPKGIFGWESYHRSDSGRFLRKLTQTAVDVVAFALPSIASLWLYNYKYSDHVTTQNNLVLGLVIWSFVISVLTTYILIFYDYKEKFKNDGKIMQALFGVAVACIVAVIF